MESSNQTVDILFVISVEEAAQEAAFYFDEDDVAEADGKSAAQFEELETQYGCVGEQQLI